VVVNYKKQILRITSVFTVIGFALIIAGCNKDNTGTESDLYGTWVKGSNFGDTLQFMKKNGKHIFRFNMSMNSAMPAYEEKEYRYRHGELSIKLYTPYSTEYRPISSFTWVQQGSEFKIQAVQLFSFLSSTLTYYSYRKL
jgi:hypothetical protein